MPISSTTYFSSGYSADKPTFLVCEPQNIASSKWCANGLPGDSDITHASYPVAALNDNNTGCYTRPASAATSVWLRYGLLSSRVDAIWMHVLSIGTGQYSIEAYLSDDSSNILLVNVNSNPFVLGKRYFWTCLQCSGDSGDIHRYFTGATVLKLKFSAISGDVLPLVTEIAVGEQFQLNRWPIYPHAVYSQESNVEVAESISGTMVCYPTYKGRYKLDEEYELTADDATIVRNLYKKADSGTRCIVYTRYAKTGQANSILLQPLSKLEVTRDISGRYIWTLQAVEQGGSFLSGE